MTGTFILSLDTEIAWGTYTDPGARASAFDAYPSLIRRLIRQLDIFEVSATWAVVGHLLLAPDERSDLTDMQYSFAATTEQQRIANGPPNWYYGRWLIDAIRSTRTPQDIGSHTMTHLLADDPAVTREMFAAQLAAVTRTHAAVGLPPPRAFVYPQNRIAHTDLLAEHGFTSYRGRERSAYTRLPRPLRRPAHLLHRALALPPPTYAPADCHDGRLVNLPASQFLMSYDGVRRHIPTAARVRQARLGIQRAIQRDEIYHLWFHPFNLGSDDAMLDALTQILALVYDARERGALRVQTMTQAAATLQ